MGSKVVKLLFSKLDVSGIEYLLDAYQQLLTGQAEGRTTIGTSGYVCYTGGVQFSQEWWAV